MRQEYLVSWFLVDEELVVLARGELTVVNDGAGHFSPVSVTQSVPVLREGTASSVVYLFRNGPLHRFVGCFGGRTPIACRVGDTASLAFHDAVFSVDVDVSALMDA